MPIKHDSSLVRFFINYLAMEILFFIGSGILAIYKMTFDVEMNEILAGTFLNSSSAGLFTTAFSPSQVNWILSNILLWPINVFLALFSSLLLLSGFFALAILIPLQIDVFSGANAINSEAISVGIMFLICWGIIPCLYIMRNTFYGWGGRIKGVFSNSPS